MGPILLIILKCCCCWVRFRFGPTIRSWGYYPGGGLGLVVLIVLLLLLFRADT